MLTYVQLTRFPDNTLQRPFALIETKIQHLTDYVGKWLQFQSLWDLETEYVFNRLGDSLANWQQLLTEIKKARATFDTSDTQKSFGVCVIDYEQVQARGERQVRRVAARYPESLRREARKRDEGDARCDPQGAQRPRAPLDRGPRRWRCAAAVLAPYSAWIFVGYFYASIFRSRFWLLPLSFRYTRCATLLTPLPTLPTPPSCLRLFLFLRLVSVHFILLLVRILTPVCWIIILIMAFTLISWTAYAMPGIYLMNSSLLDLRRAVKHARCAGFGRAMFERRCDLGVMHA